MMTDRLLELSPAVIKRFERLGMRDARRAPAGGGRPRLWSERPVGPARRAGRSLVRPPCRRRSTAGPAGPGRVDSARRRLRTPSLRPTTTAEGRIAREISAARV